MTDRCLDSHCEHPDHRDSKPPGATTETLNRADAHRRLLAIGMPADLAGDCLDHEQVRYANASNYPGAWPILEAYQRRCAAWTLTAIRALRPLIQRAAEEHASRPVTDADLADIEARTSGPGPLAEDGALLRRCVAEIRALRKGRREAAQTLIAEIGAAGPEDIEQAAARAIAQIREQDAEIDRWKTAVVSKAAERDVAVTENGRLRSEVERLTAKLAGIESEGRLPDETLLKDCQRTTLATELRAIATWHAGEAKAGNFHDMAGSKLYAAADALADASLEARDDAGTAIANAAERLIESLGEYVRQSMHANPEWRDGVVAVETALSSWKKRCTVDASRPLSVAAAADRLAAGHVQRLRDGTWAWCHDGGFDNGVVALSPKVSAWLSDVVNAHRHTLNLTQAQSWVEQRYPSLAGYEKQCCVAIAVRASRGETGPEPASEEHAVDASRPATALDRETLGRIVREVWIEWAREQTAPKPSWLVPWEGLSEPDREVDRRIGERIAREALASRPGLTEEQAIGAVRAEMGSAWIDANPVMAGVVVGLLRRHSRGALAPGDVSVPRAILERLTKAADLTFSDAREARWAAERILQRADLAAEPARTDPEAARRLAGSKS